MKILSTNTFPLPGTSSQYFHLATIEHNFREFMCFIHYISNTIFVEEITGGKLSAIEDDNLFNDLVALCTKYKITDAATIHAKVTTWKIQNGMAIEHDV